MWFVAILLAFSLGFALSTWVVELRFPRASALRLSYLAGAALTIALGSFGIRLLFPIDSRQVLDLHVWLWPQCAVLFALGLLSAQHDWLNPVPAWLSRVSGLTAIGAICAIGSLLATVQPSTSSLKGGPTGPAMFLDLMEGAYAVGASIWVLGLFQRHFAHQSRLGRWCSQNAYGAFIAQGPVLVGLALGLHAIDLPANDKFVIVAVGGVALCFIAADACRNALHAWQETSRGRRSIADAAAETITHRGPEDGAQESEGHLDDSRGYGAIRFRPLRRGRDRSRAWPAPPTLR
jgi:hypothetical protein